MRMIWKMRYGADMNEKIKVIIKRPDEKAGHMTWISNTLENLQRTVGGNIEAVTVTDRIVMICNEDGKNLNLERNFKKGMFPFADVIAGTVIICGVDGEDFGDVPIDMKQWRYILKLWGNEV